MFGKHKQEAAQDGRHYEASDAAAQELSRQTAGKGNGELIPGYPGNDNLPYLLVMGLQNNVIYLIYDISSQYYFYPVGGKHSGVDLSLIPARITRARMDAQKGSMILSRSEISKPALTRRTSISAQKPNCGFFSFRYGGKVRKFVILEHPSERQITGFLRHLDVRFPELNEKGWEIPTQEPALLEKYKVLGRILTGISAVSFFIGPLFFAVYQVFIPAQMCLFLLAYILCLTKPQYFSAVSYGKEESMELYGFETVSLIVPMFVTGILLELWVLSDIVFVSFRTVIIVSAILAMILSGVLYLRSITPKRNFGTFLLCLFATAVAAFGLLGTADWFLSPREPVHSEICTVAYEYDDDTSLQVDYQGHTLDLDYLEEDAARFSGAKNVRVYEYAGGLHLSFASLYDRS